MSSDPMPSQLASTVQTPEVPGSDRRPDTIGTTVTDTHPAIAYEPGVVPEPLDGPANPIQFLRLLRDNQLSVYSHESFVADFLQARILFQNFVLINEPAFIEHILVTNHQNYVKSRLARQVLRPVLGNGLLISEGEFWRRQRRIMAPAFNRQRIAQAASVMVRRTRQRVGQWRTACESGECLDISHEMMSLTMEIVAEALFSSEIADSIDELDRAVKTLIASLGTPNPLDILGFPEWFPRFRSHRARSALARLDKTIYDIIATRRATQEVPGDLLSLLLAARDEDTGEGMTDTQLRDEVITFFAAGHETTAQALTWTLYLLSRHPGIERRLYVEVDRVLAGREATFDDLEALPYTRMVIQEAMRLFPPAFSFSRRALADDKVGKHKIRGGSLVTISPYLTHRNPRLWKDPLRFDPDRFTSDRIKTRHRFSYLPFGGGPRICIGRGFAMAEACLVLATIASAYRLRLASGHRVEAHGRITLRPRYGLQMTLERR